MLDLHYTLALYGTLLQNLQHIAYMNTLLKSNCYCHFNFCTSIAGYVPEGNRFGQIAVALHEKFQNKYFLPRFYACYYRGVHAWTKPMAECVEPLLYAYQVGFETGDIEHALVSLLR